MTAHESDVSKSQVLIQNLIAALTVSFVAISLGAAFGLLSGRGAFAGMLSAGVIALITAALGGTRLQCSGPTAPMTAVTVAMVLAAQTTILEQHPSINPDHFINLAIFGTAVLLILFAVFRLGKYIVYVPNVVISGFMNGIAVLIWLDQIYKLFGAGGQKAFAGPLFQNLSITGLCLILLFLLPALTRRFIPQVSDLVSPTLFTIILGSTAAHVLAFDIEMVTLNATLESWSDLTNLVAAQIPDYFDYGLIWLVLPFALELAFLAYLDTMLTSLVVDKLTGEKTRPDKELMAQGIATGVVGLLGGIPGAQATIRSVLMIKERASLRLAGIMVGVFVLLEILLFQNAFSLIPQAVFAGVLVKVGYDVFDWMPVRLYIREFFDHTNTVMVNFFSRHDDMPIFVTNREMVIIVGTTLVTIIWDLNTAVIAFTAIFYLNNKVWSRKNPMRDIHPFVESKY